MRLYHGLGSALDTVYGDPSGGQAYQDALAQIAPNLPDIVSSTSDTQPWYITAMQFANTLVATDQQRQLLKIQADRAAKGLPPLDMSGYTGIGVNVGVSSSTQKTALIAIGMIAGAMLLPKLIGRR